MNHIETEILKSHEISKSCYHGGDSQGNDVRRLMARGNVVFNEVQNFILIHKPESVTVEEVNITCTNYARLCGLMDSIFSISHAKRVSMTDEKISLLKENLNLIRLKWKVSFF